MKLDQKDFEGLIEQGLVQKRVDDNGYTTYKYKNKVFYKNLWHKSPLLLEARGIVFDSDGEVAQRPFKKVFNIGENGTELDPDKLYRVARKVNGFMAAATWWEGKLLVSTTGTTTSDYAELAEKRIMKETDFAQMEADETYIFEIVDPSDPHIVREKAGVYLLGVRHKESGALMSSRGVIAKSRLIRCKIPYMSGMTGAEILSKTVTAQHEGFAIYDHHTYELIAKIKSPHYLSKKAMMRMGTNKANWMFDNPVSFKQTMVDEEFYLILDKILGLGKEYWLSLGEQDRRKIIEEYFYG